MPQRVAIVGAGMSRFGVRPETPVELFAEAFAAASQSVDRDFNVKSIDEAFVGNLGVGGWQLGNVAPFLTQSIGAAGIPSRRVENACASGGFALRDAYRTIRSGQADFVLVGGVEKMNDIAANHQRYWLGVSGDTLWERTAGLTFPGVYAQMARRHMEEYGTTAQHLAEVAVKNHANGALNPNAHFQKEVSLERAMGSSIVADPLRLYDCCATTDGAAILLVAAEELARKLTDDPVWILGSGAASDNVAAFERPSMTTIPATTAAAGQALDQARTSLKEIDLFELHDCFTIAELMALEDLGLCAPGESGPYTKSGATRRDGATPVNPSGGLKAKGHPLGATGVAQAVEVFAQLRQSAGKRQVDGASRALIHNVGGSGASCAVHVLGA